MSERRVYCLFHGFYSDRDLWGVYDTLDLAMAEHGSEDHVAEWKLFEADPAERQWECTVGESRYSFGCPFAIDERVLHE